MVLKIVSHITLGVDSSLYCSHLHSFSILSDDRFTASSKM